MQKNTEQMKLENNQIEVIVNYHGAELRSLKKKATDQEYLWNADAKYWGRTSPVLFPFVGGAWICQRHGVFTGKPERR